MTADEERVRAVLRRAAPDLAGVDAAPIVERAATRRRGVLVTVSVLLVAAVALGLGVWRVDRGERGAAPGTSVPMTTSPSNRGVTASVADVSCSPKLTGKAASSDAQPLWTLADFRPVAVVACKLGEQRYADGIWQVVRKQVSVSPLNRLIDGLSGQQYGARGGACRAFADAPPDMNLLGIDGSLMRPLFVPDQCGHVTGTPAMVAYDNLQWRTLATTKLSLIVPNDPVRRTCGDSWKDEIARDPRDMNSYSGPNQPLPLQAGTIVCVYRIGDDPMIGRFERGRRLTASEIEDLSVGLGGVGRPGQCAQQAQFAVLHSGNDRYNVELGGCRRVLRDGVFGRATTSAVTTLLRL